MSKENERHPSADDASEQPETGLAAPRTRREVLASAFALTGTVAGAASLLGPSAARAQVAGLPGGVTAPDPLGRLEGEERHAGRSARDRGGNRRERYGVEGRERVQV
jgi:hypothetical protein